METIEKNALKQFHKCAENNDYQGCLDALEHISIHTLNKQDEDGYDMLIQAVVANQVSAVRALLKDGRCDWTHAEVLCGMSAVEFALDQPGDSPLNQAFETMDRPSFIYRNGTVIKGFDVYNRIMDGTIDADCRGTNFVTDYQFARLYTSGKITKDEFESWRGDPRNLYWEAHIALLIEEEEYGKTLVDWENVRNEAEPDDWLSFLRDLPQYADEADWQKLILEGSNSGWKKLLEVCPGFQQKFQEREKYHQSMIKKYSSAAWFLNLTEACRHDDMDVVRVHLEYLSAADINENQRCSAPPGELVELPLAAAVKANALNCVLLLLDKGADSDVLCLKNNTTPRKLAADLPEALDLFNIYNGEEI